MRKLLVTKENHAELDEKSCDDNNSMRCMIDLNNLLEEELKGSCDWGGMYATWLNQLGFENQTDNGWWSLVAIDPDNIQAFIKDYTEDCESVFVKRVCHARQRIRQITRIGDFTPRTDKVWDLIYMLNEGEG